MQCLLYFGIFLLTSTISLCENDGNEDVTNTELDNSTNKQDKRKWSNFIPWGKRTPDADQELKRAWSDVSAWGKRDWYNPNWDKRKWAQMSSWGKRKWMNTWGKRKWSAMGSWGKRSSPTEDQEPTKVEDNLVSVHKRDTEHSFPAKRQWNHFVTWGKRSAPSEKKWATSLWGKRSDDPSYGNLKRKWSFSPWGKRNDDLGEMLEDKRKWAMSTWGKRKLASTKNQGLDKKWAMGAWGKRGRIYTEPYFVQSDVDFDTDIDNSISKRKWSSFVPWGKRAHWNYWNKRPWTWTKNRRGWGAMSSWGKRSGYQSTLSNTNTVL